MFLISPFQDLDISNKVKNAPDNNYEIGVFIGSMLPFIVLVILAYLVYKYNKSKKFKE